MPFSAGAIAPPPGPVEPSASADAPPPSAPSDAPPSAPPLDRSRVYTTPELVQRLLPQDGSCKLAMDQVALRWRFAVRGVNLPSIGFGPRSGLTRAESLDLAVEQIWIQHGSPRPAWARVDTIPWDAWQGVLDARVEVARRHALRG